MACAAILAIAVGGLTACGGDDDEDAPASAGGTTTGEAATGPKTERADGDATGRERPGRGGSRGEDGAPERGDSAPERGGGDPGRGDGADRGGGNPERGDSANRGGGNPERGDSANRGGKRPARARARQAVTAAYDALSDLDAVDATTLCQLMSAQARAEARQYVRATSNQGGGWSCAEAMTVLLERSKRAKGFRRVESAEVVGINVDGDRATATVRFGKRGSLTPVSLVKEDGQWKLGSAPAGGG